MDHRKLFASVRYHEVRDRGREDRGSPAGEFSPAFGLSARNLRNHGRTAAFAINRCFTTDYPVGGAAHTAWQMQQRKHHAHRSQQQPASLTLHGVQVVIRASTRTAYDRNLSVLSRGSFAWRTWWFGGSMVR
jgi:hypothetical protein